MKAIAAVFFVIFVIALFAVGKSAGDPGEIPTQIFAAFSFLGFLVCFFWPKKKSTPIQMAKPKKRRGRW